MNPRNGTTKPCAFCGEDFYTPKSRAHHRHCSNACQQGSRGSSFDPVEAFWLKVDKRGPDECWGWKAQKRWDGYGRFLNKRRPLWAHRFSYELHYGQIPAGMHVLHSCDNPSCTNPKHLRLGTHIENMKEMHSKGRGYTHGATRKDGKWAKRAA